MCQLQSCARNSACQLNCRRTDIAIAPISPSMASPCPIASSAQRLAVQRRAPKATVRCNGLLASARSIALTSGFLHLAPQATVESQCRHRRSQLPSYRAEARQGHARGPKCNPVRSLCTRLWGHRDPWREQCRASHLSGHVHTHDHRALKILHQETYGTQAKDRRVQNRHQGYGGPFSLMC